MKNNRYMHTLAGLLFGVCFPVLAVAIRVYQYGWGRLEGVIREDPLLWIIVSAPLILGLAGWLIGRREWQILDLAEHTRMRSALLTSQEDAIIGLDQHGRVMLANPAGVILLGATDEEAVLHQPVNRLPLPDELKKDLAFRRDHAEHWRDLREISWRRAGREEWHEVRCSPVDWGSAELGQGWTVACRNVTRRRLQEERERQLVRDVTGAVEEIRRLSAINRETVRAGAESVQQGIAAAQTSLQTVEELRRDSDSVGRIARRIHDNTGIISEVARQTHLLGLNAAVEAARAGDFGRGFAVVAEEIRQLAGKAGTASREIETMIGENLECADSLAGVAVATARGFQSMDQVIRQLAAHLEEIDQGSDRQQTTVETVHHTLQRQS